MRSEASGGTTLGGAVDAARARLEAAAVPGAALDARVLVCGTLGRDAVDLIAHGDALLDQAQCDAVDRNVARRLAREPVARILGQREFWSLDFRVTGATLDPRPDSETVVSAALEAASLSQRRDGELRIADLGTGSGCLIVALLSELPEARGVGIDRSSEALRVARANARDHGVSDRLELACGDWLSGCNDGFDLIVSNPPYIPTGDIVGLEAEVADHDPRGALDGGPDGLDAYREISPQAYDRLDPGGWLVLEIGDGQADAVSALLSTAGFSLDGELPSRIKDLGGKVRCLRGRR